MALLTENCASSCAPCGPCATVVVPAGFVIQVYDPAENAYRTLSAPDGILTLSEAGPPISGGAQVVVPCQPGGVPGPKGDPGAAGAAAIGINAFTALTVGFTVPGIGSNVTIQVGSTLWMGVGEPLFIASAGFYLVVSITDNTHVIVQNLGYDGNAVAGLNIATAQIVTPAGLKGDDGATGSGVTSVGLSVPSWLTVTGSPVTTAGTLAITAASGQTPNLVIATPNGSSGAISLRALVANDIPALPFSKITTGTVGIANGGTGQSSATSAFNALSPSTTKGDLIVNNGTDDIRVVVGTDGMALIANSATASGVAWSFGETIQNSTPSSGDNVVFNTVLTNLTLYITPAGTLATLSLTLPADASSRIGQICRAFTTQTLTALTVTASGGSIVGTAITTLAQYGMLSFQKVAASTWIRLT